MKRFLKYKLYLKLMLITCASTASMFFASAPARAATNCGVNGADSNGACCAEGDVALPNAPGSKIIVCCPLAYLSPDKGAHCTINNNDIKSCGVAGVIVQGGTALSCFYNKYLNPFIQVLSAAVGIVAVAAIIWGGVEYITSANDPQRVAAARKRIISALIGLAAYFLFYALLQFLLPGGIFNGQ